MAIAYSAEAASICQEAMFLLRQDITVPSTAAAWYANTPIEWWKCRTAFETAVNEIVSAFAWKATVTAANIANWPAKVRNACVHCLAKECAIPIAGRIEDMKVMDALYQQKLTVAKLTDLNEYLSTSADPVLLRLVSNFKADDPALVTAFAVYTQRATVIKAESDKEVKKILELNALDDLAQQASHCLSVSRLAAVCGIDANTSQLLLQDYRAKLNEWRKQKLDTALAANTDPILAQLVANFKGDDTALMNAFTVYTNRVSAVKTMSEATVKDALGIASLSGRAADAAVMLSVLKLAHACGADPNTISVLQQAYDKTILETKRDQLDADVASNGAKITACRNEVKLALGVNSLDAIGESAAVSLCYAKHGGQYGYDANYIQLKDQEYLQKVAEWRKVKLNKQLETESDPVLNELLMNFRGDDTGLLNAYTAYTHRATVVKAESDKEVKGVLGITAASLDDLAQQASYCLSVSKLAISIGLAADFANLKKQEYLQKVQEWRKVKLNTALAANTDPILAEIVGNFKTDDAGLVNAFTVYTQRVAAAKAATVIEINNAHSWRTAFAQSSTTHVAYPAFVELVASRLALVCGLDANAVQLFENKYLKRLTQARIADLDAAKAAITDIDTKEVMSMILTDFAEGGRLPRSLTDITDRIDAVKATARKDVLLAHDWTFAKVVEETGGSTFDSNDVPYPWSVAYPRHALRLVACYGGEGEPIEWRIDGGFIRARMPVSRIRYTKDVTDIGRWKEFARAAYIRRLAALVARTVTDSPQEAQMQEQLYRDALETAKLRDSKETNTPEDAWGGNHYADAMHGGHRRRDRAEDIFRR